MAKPVDASYTLAHNRQRSTPHHDDLHGPSHPYQNELDYAPHASHSASRQALAGPSVEKPHIDQTGRRGRRRRSSEFAQCNTDVEDTDVDDEEAGGEAQSLLWWQRPIKPPSASDSSEKPILYPLQMQSGAAMSSSPSSNSLRSPAANFLSSMNESLGSPPSISSIMNGSLNDMSAAPTRSDPSGTASASHSKYGHSPRNIPMHRSEGSPFGLASAAAEIYGIDQNGNGSRRKDHLAKRSDEEGSRIGANGRYLLGKTIGFGGFSTIREAWDLGEDVNEDSVQTMSEMHRVAVKIIYSSESKGGVDHIPNDDELKIWETIPSHPNLLPLLHHERVQMAGTDVPSSVVFLVMPFCQGSLLTYVKNEGSLLDIDTSHIEAGGSVSRSASIHGSQIISPLTDLFSDQSQQHRTGSGFIPRNTGMRVASVPLSHLMGRSSSSAGSTNSLLRRASSRISRPQRQTNGVPFSSVREVMKQLVDALVCLHCRANISHGDLKLENVLGQQSFTSTRRDRASPISSTDEDGHTAGASESLQSFHDAETSLIAKESICWRIADFGASMRKDARKRKGNEFEERHTKREKDSITGGSLAYTAPEMFLTSSIASEEMGENESISPFAQDMWALGCILYCLCSGRLPFADSFEPRLQVKIAKGHWDMPSRLRRRQERANAATTAMDAANRSRRQSNDRGISGVRGVNRNSSLSISLATSRSTQIAGLPPSTSEAIDMSASMPSLRDQPHLYDAGLGSTSEHSIVMHDADPSMDYSEDHLEESNSESDADEHINQQMDGTSRERVQIRLALRKLLESDPRKRWTIQQFARQPWLQDCKGVPFSSELDEEEDQFHAQSYLARPSLATDTATEETSHEHAESEIYDDATRGRSQRRDVMSNADQSRAARPIDIDRSSSRSRSRPGIDRLRSSPWYGENSSFETRYKQSKGWANHEHSAVATGERRVKRSISADNRSLSRGRTVSSSDSSRALPRSVSRPPRLDMKDLHHTLPPLQTEQSSAAPTTSSSSSSASRSTTSRSRSRARDALNDIASRGHSRQESPAIVSNDMTTDDKLWWQRGRRNGR